MYRKITLIFVALAIFVVGIFSIRFVFGGPEDSWICVNNQWVKHGNPKDPAPVTGCGTNAQTGLANPASVYCKNNNGEVIIKIATDGSQSGWCKLANGQECEEWVYYRENKCIPPQETVSPPATEVSGAR